MTTRAQARKTRAESLPTWKSIRAPLGSRLRLLAVRLAGRPLLAACGSLALLGGCAQPPVLVNTPTFEPVMPKAVEVPPMATGGIYNGRKSDSWFGRGRSYRVGDVITVLLNEEAQAARNQSAIVKRESENTVIPTGIAARITAQHPFALKGLNLNESTIKSEGTGTANQRATLTGSVAAMVVEVLPNGNLVVRGEKQLALAEGIEVIQVSGIIRPDDVSANNVVQSRRLANAQIAYRGVGDMNDASRPGWGTRLMMKLWPL